MTDYEDREVNQVSGFRRQMTAWAVLGCSAKGRQSRWRMRVPLAFFPPDPLRHSGCYRHDDADYDATKAVAAAGWLVSAHDQRAA